MTRFWVENDPPFFQKNIIQFASTTSPSKTSDTERHSTIIHHLSSPGHPSPWRPARNLQTGNKLSLKSFGPWPIVATDWAHLYQMQRSRTNISPLKRLINHIPTSKWMRLQCKYWYGMNEMENIYKLWDGGGYPWKELSKCSSAALTLPS